MTCSSQGGGRNPVPNRASKATFNAPSAATQFDRDPNMLHNVLMAGYLPRGQTCEKKHSAAGEQRAKKKRSYLHIIHIRFMAASDDRQGTLQGGGCGGRPPPDAGHTSPSARGAGCCVCQAATKRAVLCLDSTPCIRIPLFPSHPNFYHSYASLVYLHAALNPGCKRYLHPHPSLLFLAIKLHISYIYTPHLIVHLYSPPIHPPQFPQSTPPASRLSALTTTTPTTFFSFHYAHLSYV